MFCFQCEQTAQGKGCTFAQGVCGKKAETADLQDDLTSALIKLAVAGKETPETTDILVDGLFTTITNVNFDDNRIEKLVQKASFLTPQSDFKIADVWNMQRRISVVLNLLFCLG